jgi:hypothetical protein
MVHPGQCRSDAAFMNEPVITSLRPRRSRRYVVIVLGLCTILGGVFWARWQSNSTSESSTVIVTVRSDVSQQPIPGVDVILIDVNSGMPTFVPPWLSQCNPMYRQANPVTTDSSGTARIPIPQQVPPHEVIRFRIGLDPRTIPPGLSLRTMEGRLFDDHTVTLWLRPTAPPRGAAPAPPMTK